MSVDRLCWVCRNMITLQPTGICQSCQNLGLELECAMVTAIFDCPVCGEEQPCQVIHCQNPACTPPCERLECLACGANVAAN